MSEPMMIEKANGDKEWYLNGKLHREDGPAMVWANGSKEWWLNGNIYTFDEFLEETPLSHEEKIVLKLTYMTEFA